MFLEAISTMKVTEKQKLVGGQEATHQPLEVEYRGMIGFMRLRPLSIQINANQRTSCAHTESHHGPHLRSQ